MEEELEPGVDSVKEDLPAAEDAEDKKPVDIHIVRGRILAVITNLSKHYKELKTELDQLDKHVCAAAITPEEAEKFADELADLAEMMLSLKAPKPKVVILPESAPVKGA